MLSGYNESSLEEIKECILCCAKHNGKNKSELKKLELLDVKELASQLNIEIQESDSEFPETEDPIHLITEECS